MSRMVTNGERRKKKKKYLVLISEIRGQKTPPFSRPSVAIGVYLWLDPHSSFALKISFALEFSSVKNYTIFLELEHETDEFGNSYFRRFNNC